jgi:hypothetical protein
MHHPFALGAQSTAQHPAQLYMQHLMLQWTTAMMNGKQGATALPPSVTDKSSVITATPPRAAHTSSAKKTSVQPPIVRRERTVTGVCAEQPLDLTKTSTANGGDDKINDDASQANGKKTYSAADLNAAVHDIRHGKLGTRRASVVYGRRARASDKLDAYRHSTINTAQQDL